MTTHEMHQIVERMKSVDGVNDVTVEEISAIRVTIKTDSQSYDTFEMIYNAEMDIMTQFKEQTFQFSINFI